MLTFEEVYKYKGALQKYLRGKLPPADAEDVLQETFLRAAQGLEKYDPQRGSVYTWLLAILKGRLRLAYTGFHKRKELQCTVDLEYPITPHDELVLKEALKAATPDIVVEPWMRGAERMRRVRARKKFADEMLL